MDSCLVLSGMLTVFPKELMPVDNPLPPPRVLNPPFGVSMHRVGCGEVLSSLSLPSTRPWGPFKEQDLGGPAVPEKAHSVPAPSSQAGGGEGKGLAEAAAHGRRERRRQESVVCCWRWYFHPDPNMSPSSWC